MIWWYRKISNDAKHYVYAYSHECKDLDGVISYDIASKKASIIKVSKFDNGSEWAISRSLGHFYAQVVDENFPEERYVCCG